MDRIEETLERNLGELNKYPHFTDKVQFLERRISDWQGDIGLQMVKLDELLKLFVRNVTVLGEQIIKSLVTEGSMVSKRTTAKKPKRKKEQQRKSDDPKVFNNLSRKTVVQDDGSTEFQPNQYSIPLMSLQKGSKKLGNQASENYVGPTGELTAPSDLPVLEKSENVNTKSRKRMQPRYTGEDDSICRRSTRLATHPPGHFQTKPQSFVFLECTSNSMRRKLERSLGNTSAQHFPWRQGTGDYDGSDSTLLASDTLENVDKSPNGDASLSVSEMGKKPTHTGKPGKKRIGG